MKEEDGSIESGIEYMYKIGLTFIVIGFVLGIGVLMSFDWDMYYEYKNSYEEELQNAASGELITIWVMAIVAVVVPSAIGLLFMALDRIAHTLRLILHELRNDKEIRVDKNEQ